MVLEVKVWAGDVAGRADLSDDLIGLYGCARGNAAGRQVAIDIDSAVVGFDAHPLAVSAAAVVRPANDAVPNGDQARARASRIVFSRVVPGGVSRIPDSVGIRDPSSGNGRCGSGCRRRHGRARGGVACGIGRGITRRVNAGSGGIDGE